MPSGSTGYSGINTGRAGRGKASAARARPQVVRRRETQQEGNARRARTGDFF